MKKKYLGLAVTSILAFSMLATSAHAGNVDAQTLDGLDSTDFALATHAHSTSDVTGLDAELAAKADQTDVDAELANLEIADANPVLPTNSSEPYTCEAADAGAIVLTSRFTTCACNGYKWVLTADGTTDCDWNVLTVTSAGQVWMDRNLGASQVATSPTDSAAYGDLYQWGRGADGHQLRTSGTIDVTSDTDDPGHDDFIIYGTTTYYDWRSPQNDSLWQGVGGTNNPCPAGFRLPTDLELETEMLTWSSLDEIGAFDSPLKLTVAGIRKGGDGMIVHNGGGGWYYSGSVTSGRANTLTIYYGDAYMEYGLAPRSYGASVRCLQD